MEQSPSWEANSQSASQEIPLLLWNPKVRYHIHKNLSLVLILIPLVWFLLYSMKEKPWNGVAISQTATLQTSSLASRGAFTRTRCHYVSLVSFARLQVLQPAFFHEHQCEVLRNMAEGLKYWAWVTFWLSVLFIQVQNLKHLSFLPSTVACTHSISFSSLLRGTENQGLSLSRDLKALEVGLAGLGLVWHGTHHIDRCCRSRW
jgi:hypothetical protein